MSNTNNKEKEGDGSSITVYSQERLKEQWDMKLRNGDELT